MMHTFCVLTCVFGVVYDFFCVLGIMCAACVGMSTGVRQEAYIL